MQVIDASISESIYNMLEACIPEYVHHGHVRPPSGSTISGPSLRQLSVSFSCCQPCLAELIKQSAPAPCVGHRAPVS